MSAKTYTYGFPEKSMVVPEVNRHVPFNSIQTKSYCTAVMRECWPDEAMNDSLKKNKIPFTCELLDRSVEPRNERCLFLIK